jgi:hypothetical protein
VVIPGIGDAPFTVVRPIAATYEDGTGWASATAVSTVPTPVPMAADDTPPPAWDATHHTGYVAVESGGGTPDKPAPYLISLFAPGHRAPSATLTFPKCCVMAIAFDPSGGLLVATMGLHEGLLMFAPGATKPTKSFADHDGFALAVDDAGDLAIGGFNSGPDVAVYPSDGAAYRIPGQPVPGGLAFGPNGELALAEYKSGNVRIYPRGASAPAREFPLSSVATPRGMYIVGSLTYDRAGDLAVYDFRAGVVRVYPPGSDQPAYAVPARYASGVAFDGSGNLVISSNLVTSVYAPRAVTPTKTIVRGGAALAADARGRFVIADPFRNELIVVDTDGRQTVVPGFDRPSHVVISP